MKKTIFYAVLFSGLFIVVIAVIGNKAGWFSGGDSGETKDQPKRVISSSPPKALPELTTWLEKRVGSEERRLAGAGYTELARPETRERLLKAVQDQKTPLPLRKRALLLLAHDQGKCRALLAVLGKHAGDPQSPLRKESVVILAGLPKLEQLDEKGFIAVTLATASKDSDEKLRLAATHGLVRFSSRPAVQALVARLSDNSVMVRKIAAGRLKKLAGRDMGYRYSGNPKGQSRAIAAWQAWAAAHKPGR